ncbi:MAG: hypothetical protein DRH08_11195 [Deltaproteobacteria bacterium]|nr:MAG: hypothetical protein DRH08_11195 [Deltaproteobacteria bacterium]
MSSRTNSWNGYESKLATQLLAGETTTSVESALGLTEPVYLCVDPDKPLEREWIRVTLITGNTFNTVERGLDGSAGAPGVGVDHAVGALVRAVTTGQFMSDVFNDIEALESATGGLPNTYLKLDATNGPLTGPLVLDGANPTADDVAARKKYVDDQRAAAEGYADGLDHDHATPIGVHDIAADAHGVKDNTDAPGNPHNHDRYTDQEAKDAVGFEDIYVKTAGGDTITGDLTVEGLMKVGVLQARINDIVFEALSGTDLLRWDDSANEWVFKKDITLDGNILKAPAVPAAGNHVGDQDFNDARYPVTEDGAMGLTTPYGCDVYSSATQSVPANEWDLLRMNVERYDPHGDFSLASGVERYTVPKTGLYVFGASARMNADDITQLRIQVEHSTGAAYEQETFPDGDHDPFISVFGIRYCLAGETLRARLYQISPGARPTYANVTRFWAGRLS